MPQLNIHLTPEFQQSLAEYMRLRHLKTKSDAIRQAVREALERERLRRQIPDFTTWIELGTRPCPPEPKSTFPLRRGSLELKEWS